MSGAIRRRTLVGGASGAAALAGLAGQPAQAAAATPSWVTPSSNGLVALTFDDGPSPTLTPYVLSILALYRVKATFFLQGEHAAKYPALVRRIAAGGHVIGNHGWSHTDFTELTAAQARSEIVRTNEAIFNATGKTPVLFRYPYGNETADGNAVIRELGMWGGVLWHWQSKAGDYECPGALGVREYVLANAVDQALILLHDGNEVTRCSASQPWYLGSTIAALRLRKFELGVVEAADGPSPVNGYSWVRVVKPN
ncbi:polysaccharide deacetylase family protein [Dermacoccaceae bacterium W4C1]